jgi:hypothetical protein
VVLLVIIAVGVGGWYYTSHRKPAGDGKTGTGPTTGTETTTAAGPSTPIPPGLAERLDFLESQGQYDRALELALDKLKELPDCADLKNRIADYRHKLGQDPIVPADVLRAAGEQVEAKQWAEAKDGLTTLLDGGVTMTDAQRGEAFLMRAECNANLDDKLAASNDLESAKAAGADAGRIGALRDKYGLTGG